ncbi:MULTISPECIES: type II toxin-antitoxin system RatA family toxin [Streptomyces]|uniref:type II toxin-antitoxin system RatA family toxin n=1 Tax=Streptomyces TaxID=1883 RepID=UPI0036B43CA3
MPTVITESTSQLAAGRIWKELLDCESFHTYMDVVRKVEILDWQGDRRVSAWSVLLKGSVLEWEEEEVIDHEGRIITFHQIEGDMAYFKGTWQVIEDSEVTRVRLEVDFDIGIPLLAEMLNPVASRALEDYSNEVVRHLEERTAI